MRQGTSDGLGRAQIWFFSEQCAAQVAQDGIHERRSRALPRSLYQFDALVKRGACGNASEMAELVEREAKSDENFEIEFRKRLRRCVGDFLVEARTPADDSHH